MQEIRRANQQDLQKIVAIENRTFHDPWSEQSFRASFGQKHICFFVCAEAEIIKGYCILSCLFDEAEILSIAVDPDYQREHLGTLLLGKAIDAAKMQGASCLLLEVRESNKAAICLYDKMDFQKIGIRRDYYENPRENAILMNKIL